MPTSAPKARPTASLLHDPLIYLLGKRSGFKPFIGVPHKEIEEDVLLLAGISVDPAQQDSDSYQNRNWLFRIVHFAWRNQRHGYCGSKPALCAKPTSGARGEWALTCEGVRKAKQLQEKYENKIVFSSPNATARFLSKDFPSLFERLTMHLRRKMPRSEHLDKTNDHAMNWLSRVIARDGLRARLEEGRPPAPSHMCAWTVRSAYSDIRNEGREPVCRVLHGALTKPEIQLLSVSNWTTAVIPRTLNDSERLSGIRHSDHGEDETATSDITDSITDTTNVEQALASSDAFELILTKLALIVRDELDGEDAEWHIDLAVDRFAKEMTIREIAETRGLVYEDARPKITKAIERVRHWALQARKEGEFDAVLTG